MSMFAWFTGSRLAYIQWRSNFSENLIFRVTISVEWWREWFGIWGNRPTFVGFLAQSYMRRPLWFAKLSKGYELFLPTSQKLTDRAAESFAGDYSCIPLQWAQWKKRKGPLVFLWYQQSIILLSNKINQSMQLKLIVKPGQVNVNYIMPIHHKSYLMKLFKDLLF